MALAISRPVACLTLPSVVRMRPARVLRLPAAKLAATAKLATTAKLAATAKLARTAVLATTAVLAACSASHPPAATGSSPPSPSASARPTATPGASSAPQQSAVPAEKNPPGDIPDNLAFVRYANVAGHYRFTHPEGWAETVTGPQVLFTDKLNGVSAQPGTAVSAPTVSTARAQDVPALRRSQPAFELRSVTAAVVPGGSGVRIVYRRNSSPDPVTGRQYRDEVERYELVHAGREVVLEMFGPIGADNVDAYRTMVQSLAIA